jgi:tetratricopeptide (TPR) repeat protein
MAIISLRAYNHEIEGMIDNGQLDEAVAHCRHILTTFPKHIATYRLLGKAHLEQQRISDATDIFQRVLSAIPDDFISNVGMSIIREDENNLDAAIWHMELAYESQPSNIAIQDELRRLYGRRDGMQLPKVRLTRGALARMYVKGGLFDQAIAELRAAIAEDPNRPDLQLLLAQMFFQTSQRVEAVEASVNILKKIPLCLEANRILAISLPEGEGSDAVRNSRQIVISMDPYFAFAEPEAISSDLVSENAVNIERLEWKSGIQVGKAPNQPAWATSLGINMEKPAEENIPDWLKAAEAPALKPADEKGSPSISPFIWDTQEVEKIITDTSKPEGEIPDWMKDAGWKPATGEAAPPPEQRITPEEPTPASPVSDDLQQADIPEWLRGIAPDDFTGPQGKQAQPEEDTLSSPWLEPHQPGPTDSIIHWLEEKQPDASATPQAQEQNIAFSPDDEVPDWLKDLDIPQTSSAEGESPVAPPAASTSLTSAFLDEPPAAKTAEIEPAPLEMAAGPAPEVPTVQPETPPSPQDLVIEQPAAPAEEEIPDWMKDMAVVVPAAEAIKAALEKTSEEAPPVSEPEPVSQPIAAEVPPENMPSLAEQPLAIEAPPTEEIQSAVTEKPAQEQEPEEEAPIESELPMAATAVLAAEELAKPEETQAEQQPAAEEAVPAAEMPVPTESTPALEAPMTAEIAATEVPVQAEEAPAAESPTRGSEEPQIVQLIPAEAEIPPAEPDAMNEASAFAWLEGLAAEQEAKEEGLVTPPLAGEIQPPEWVKLETEPITEEPVSTEPPVAAVEQAQPAEEVPDWIKGLGEEPAVESTPVASESLVPPASEEATVLSAPAEAGEENLDELPAWLLEMDKPEEEKEAPAQYGEELEWNVEELPDWLKEITESEAPTEVAPAQPVSAAEEVTPVDKQGLAAEVATAAVIAGLAKPEEAVPPAETVEQSAEIPQPEVPVPIQTEVPAALTGEETTTMEVEPPSVELEQGPTPVEAVIAPDPAEAILTGARTALNQGQPSQAMGLYARLIKENYRLDEIIKDLQEALYRSPIDVDMWVTLGDAHSHTHALQEALNAYTKAEQLVR